MLRSLCLFTLTTPTPRSTPGMIGCRSTIRGALTHRRLGWTSRCPALREGALLVSTSTPLPWLRPALPAPLLAPHPHLPTLLPLDLGPNLPPPPLTHRVAPRPPPIVALLF